MSDKDSGNAAVVTAILDLTRVTLALSMPGPIAEKVRKLSDLSIPPPRIAAILAIPLKQVHSELSKAKQRRPGKAKAGRKGKG